MDWSFDCPNGGVTVRQEGGRAVCQVISRAEGEGLYKAWLTGEEGVALLGTLIPEGGALRLRRNIPLTELKEKGAWPPTGAEIAPAAPLPPETPPRWSWTDCPARLFEDRALSRAVRGVGRALLRRDTEGFFLAVPYSPACPFPIPALFCLSRIERLGERRYAIFRFSRQGAPELLHNFSLPGETESVT